MRLLYWLEFFFPTFADHDKLHAFSQKCIELGVPTYIQPNLLSFEEYKPKTEEELRQRWKQVLDDAEVAKAHQIMLDNRNKRLAMEALEKSKEAESALKQILAKVQNIEDQTLGEIQAWYSGKSGRTRLGFFMFICCNRRKKLSVFFFATVCLDNICEKSRNIPLLFFVHFYCYPISRPNLSRIFDWKLPQVSSHLTVETLVLQFQERDKHTFFFL